MGMPASSHLPRRVLGVALLFGLAACDAEVLVAKLVDAGVDASTCLPLDAGCSSDADCCSGDCDSDRCAPPGVCGGDNAGCADDADCCQGLTCGCKGFLCSGTNTCCLSVTSDIPCTDVSECCGTLARGCRYDFARKHLACCNWVSEPCLSDADCCPIGNECDPRSAACVETGGNAFCGKPSDCATQDCNLDSGVCRYAPVNGPCVHDADCKPDAGLHCLNFTCK